MLFRLGLQAPDNKVGNFLRHSARGHVKLDDEIVIGVRIVGVRKANVGIAGATQSVHTSVKYAVLDSNTGRKSWNWLQV